MSIETIRELVNDELIAVNQFIRQELAIQHPFVNQLTEHLLNGGGKQLRPLIVLLCCKALNYSGQNQVKIAAIIEFFHTASLLHDDVVDESKLRRGQKTAHEIWGNQASVLVGDYLFILHHQLLLSLKNFEMLELMADIERKIGYGELVQLTHRYQANLQTADYFSIIEAKTSLLFAACAKLSGILCGLSTEDSQHLFQYGLHLGNAFQLIDDVLDYCSDSQTIGKNIGDDLADGKTTLPIIHALAQASFEERSIIEQSLQQGSIVYLDKIINIIHQCDSIQYTKNIAHREAQFAKDALCFLADSPFKEALLAIADYSIQRNH